MTTYLIIGTGVSGLSLALKLAQNNKVILTSKAQLPETNSALAQGGVASVTQINDTFDQHVEDTLSAGAGLCHKPTVINAVEQAPQRIQDLVSWGVNFDSINFEKFSLTKEGGHSKRRILHIADKTGAHIHSQLVKMVTDHKNISLHENLFATDLIMSIEKDPFKPQSNKCLGAKFLKDKSQKLYEIYADYTILATGGAGKVYLYTSNWSGATGDGVAMAHRAGAKVANLEFTQFHPTCLYHPYARNFLISEAVRGEGGRLINASGKAFMDGQHELKELAPRDIVTRAIDREIKQTAKECVFIDITHKGSDFLSKRFPLIYNKCMELGIDISKQPIPVVPAAHYQCGGILVNQWGETNLPHLFAVGETACNGIHGANRLASNSLLDCLTSSHNCYLKLKDAAPFNKEKQISNMLIAVSSQPKPSEKLKQEELIVIEHMWEEVRRLMWNYVGIVRSNKRLANALDRVLKIQNEVNYYANNFSPNTHIEELKNITLMAKLIIECALRRAESRGVHYNLNFPEQLDEAKNSII